jgi:hypothetical protein
MARSAIFENVELPAFMWQYRSWEDIKSASWFTKINWLNIALLVVTLGFAIYQARSKYVSWGHLCIREVTKWMQEASKKAGFESRYLKAPNFPEPGELHGFDYSKTEPLKLRPFKPKYHLTMGTYDSTRP